MNCPKCGLPMILTESYRYACASPGYPFNEYQRLHPPPVNDYDCAPCDDARMIAAVRANIRKAGEGYPVDKIWGVDLGTKYERVWDICMRAFAEELAEVRREMRGKR